MATIHVLPPTSGETIPLLEEMLFEAFFWNPVQERPDPVSFRKHPEFDKLLAGWGRPGDLAVAAVDAGTTCGAAWYRFWTDEVHSYGYVDGDTPEIGLAVRKEKRGQGIGRLLLRALIEEAGRQDIRALSLSVDPSNYALQLYLSEGFVKTGESGTSWTMIRPIGPGHRPTIP